MSDEKLEYQYVGGGYYRKRGVAKGISAPTLHGEEILEYYEKQIAKLNKIIELERHNPIEQFLCPDCRGKGYKPPNCVKCAIDKEIIK